MPAVIAVAPFVTSQVMAVSSTRFGSAGPGVGRNFARRGRARQPGADRTANTLESGSLAGLEKTHPGDGSGQGRQAASWTARRDQSASSSHWISARGVGDPVTLISPASLGAGIGPPRLKRFVVDGLLSLRHVRVRFDADFRRAQRWTRAAGRRFASRERARGAADQHVRRAGGAQADRGDRGAGFRSLRLDHRERAALLRASTGEVHLLHGADADRAGGGLQHYRDAGDGRDGAAQGNRHRARDGRAGRFGRRDFSYARARCSAWSARCSASARAS